MIDRKSELHDKKNYFWIVTARTVTGTTDKLVTQPVQITLQLLRIHLSLIPGTIMNTKRFHRNFIICEVIEKCYQLLSDLSALVIKINKGLLKYMS